MVSVRKAWQKAHIDEFDFYPALVHDFGIRFDCEQPRILEL